MGVLEIYQDADCTNHDSLFCLRQQWLPTHSPATYINRVPVHQGPRNEGQKPSHNRLSGSRYVGFYRAYRLQVRRYIVLWRERRGNTQRERERETDRDRELQLVSADSRCNAIHINLSDTRSRFDPKRLLWTRLPFARSACNALHAAPAITPSSFCPIVFSFIRTVPRSRYSCVRGTGKIFPGQNPPS